MTKYIVTRANLMVFGVLIAILALVSAATWDRFSAARSARNWSQHSYAVLGALGDLNLSIRDAETGQRGYLLTGSDVYLQPYTAALGTVTLLEGELQQLTADNPIQQQNLQVLAPIIQRKLNELAATVQARRDFGLDAQQGLVPLLPDRGRAAQPGASPPHLPR
jgi:CHASE3 domain sensor protein